jgi:diaminopimelate epimerase
MRLRFYKMQATGNDFVVIDNRTKQFNVEEIIAFTPKLCDRRLGVGADGILVLDPSDSHDFTMIYRNADGSDAGMCGNGGRAISLFANHLGLGNHLRFKVHDAAYSAQVSGPEVTLHFDSLICKVEEVPYGSEVIYNVYSGTDHVVVRSDANLLTDLETLRLKGAALRYDPIFAPKGTNVNFSCSKDHDIQLRTYERGVEDLTLACGTGSIASSIVEHHIHKDNSDETHIEFKVSSLGGVLDIGFSYDKTTDTYFGISLKGEAKLVFEGEIQIHD